MGNEVTSEMLLAAIKQASKEGIIKGNEVVTMDEFERRTEAWERIILAAINANISINRNK